MIINPGQHATLIGIDVDVLAALKSRAEPFVDDPNTVLRRELGIDNGESSSGDSSLVLREVRASREPRSRPRKQRATRAVKIKAPRARKGSLTPEDAFEGPLLRALESAGGRLPVREAMDRLANDMSSTLNEEDRFRDSKGVARWEKRVHFVRLKLVDRGLMSNDAPRGTWEITEQGRERLADSLPRHG